MPKGNKNVKNKGSDKNDLDFDNLKATDVANLDINDTSLLKKFGLQAFPDYSDMDETEQYYAYRKYFTNILVMGSIIEKFREQAFEKLKQLKPNNVTKEFNEEMSDEVTRKKKSKGKIVDDSDEEDAPKKGKSVPKKSKVDSDDEDNESNDESEDIPKKGKAFKSKHNDSDEEESEASEDSEPPKKGKFSKNKKMESDDESDAGSDVEESNEESNESEEEESDEPKKKGKKTKPTKRGAKHSKSR